MSFFPARVMDYLHAHNVRLLHADRSQLATWNEAKGADELRFLGGYYWYVQGDKNMFVTDNGPFPTKSAAYRAAYIYITKTKKIVTLDFSKNRSKRQWGRMK